MVTNDWCISYMYRSQPGNENFSLSANISEDSYVILILECQTGLRFKTYQHLGVKTEGRHCSIRSAQPNACPDKRLLKIHAIFNSTEAEI